MDPIGFGLIVICVVYAAFLGYMLIHHPETMFRLQKNAQEVQDRYVKGAVTLGTKAVIGGIKMGMK